MNWMKIKKFALFLKINHISSLLKKRLFNLLKKKTDDLLEK